MPRNKQADSQVHRWQVSMRAAHMAWFAHESAQACLSYGRQFPQLARTLRQQFHPADVASVGRCCCGTPTGTEKYRRGVFLG